MSSQSTELLQGHLPCNTQFACQLVAHAVCMEIYSRLTEILLAPTCTGKARCSPSHPLPRQPSRPASTWAPLSDSPCTPGLPLKLRGKQTVLRGSGHLSTAAGGSMLGLMSLLVPERHNNHPSASRLDFQTGNVMPFENFEN